MPKPKSSTQPLKPQPSSGAIPQAPPNPAPAEPPSSEGSAAGNLPPAGDAPATTLRACAYVRMSTEHQQYSTNNQMDIVREYAASRSMEIVKIYSDEGKSGLNIQGRDSLGRMIADVQAGTTDFTEILVYDVSRWGRFQDADESAYYEYICRRAGIHVHYCAEQFENDGSPISTIVKGVKRAMAGEYSRELSSKVFQGACRLIQLGYKQGGTAGFGLRRMLVDQSGAHKGILKIGEHKSLQTDRVILVPGPEEELAIVRWMYDAFLDEGKPESQIARELNERDVLTDLGREWTRSTVHQVLTNEKYIGNNVYHRTSFKLKKAHVTNPEDKWVRGDASFEPVVDPERFFQVRGIIISRSQRLSDEEMLAILREILARHARLSSDIINEYEDAPSSTAYRCRFGSLTAAYQLIGYAPSSDYRFLEINSRLRRLHPETITSIISQLEAVGAAVTKGSRDDILHLNGEIQVSIILCRNRTSSRGVSRWVIRRDEGPRSDITVAARMCQSNETILDYYLLPALEMTSEIIRLAEENGVYLDSYRFDSLDYLLDIAERVIIEEAA
ncbi:MAG: recombinase family protein [Terrimicrobiaceae bacterium]